jgi:hypothetical protein
MRGLLFSAFWLLAGGYTTAAEISAQAVQIKIETILASNQSDEFDTKLAPLQRQLKVMKYRSYRLLKEDSQTVPWQNSATFEIPGGRSLTVTAQEFRNKRLALKVGLQQGDKPLLDTTVRMNNGGNFLLGGPRHEGGALIISIWATAQ